MFTASSSQPTLDKPCTASRVQRAFIPTHKAQGLTQHRRAEGGGNLRLHHAARQVGPSQLGAPNVLDHGLVPGQGCQPVGVFWGGGFPCGAEAPDTAPVQTLECTDHAQPRTLRCLSPCNWTRTACCVVAAFTHEIFCLREPMQTALLHAMLGLALLVSCMGGLHREQRSILVHL